MVAVFAGVGCTAPPSQYGPKYPRNGELVWRVVDGDMRLAKDGRNISDLSELPDEVGCAPAAVADARKGNELSDKGDSKVAAGLGILLTGAITGTVMIASGSLRDSDSVLWAGVGVLAGGFIVGTTYAGIGGKQSSEGLAHRLDAINRYNDDLYLAPGCGGTRPTAASQTRDVEGPAFSPLRRPSRTCTHDAQCGGARICADGQCEEYRP